MKNHIIILCIGLFTIFISSCEKYLDKAPESTLTQEDVFSNFDNFKDYFDAVYIGQPSGLQTNWAHYRNNENIFVSFNMYFNGIPRAFSLEEMTDLCDGGWIREEQTIKGGQMGNLIRFFYDATAQRPILKTMFRVIRVCNVSLQKIGGLKDVSQEEIDDIIAQIYFVRAYAHFNLFRFWGPMPYITKPVGPYDSWDLPRLSKHETLMHIAADLDTAVTFFEKAGRMRRDNPVVGGAGHLNHPEQFKPAGVVAKALKARILLYAASPLNNEHGITDWEEAAEANWEAIQIALQNGHFLLPGEDYKLNYVGANYTDEQLWAWAAGPQRHNSSFFTYLINGIFKSSGTTSADCPTQNCVDKFETSWGDPLNTQADRDAATALGHYNEQDPYKDREPRFYIDIIYNEANIPGFETAKIYYETVGGNIQYSQLLNQNYTGITSTGYYQRKMWGGQSVLYDISPLHTDPFIRLTELYLNYAEAANEAYGPKIIPPYASLSAEGAINLIRQRIGQVDVLSRFTLNTETFRPRIKNERIVELCFEGHYYFDIRRWMDAPVTMAGPMMGMSIEKVPVDATYPRGYKHTRMAIPNNRQSTWKDAMYYFPFYESDYFKMKNFDMSLNPYW